MEKTDMNKERLFWDKEYENYLRIWGDRPSELAIIAVKYLKSHQLEDKYLSVLDICCGYGRDCLYLARHLNCCIVFASNLYQILQRKQREELRKKVANLLKPQGLLFLNSLSTNDPEEYGKGEPCPDEQHSFINKKYLHFCTREDMEEDFQFLSIKELYEHEYDEPGAQGETHHHISWITPS